MAKPFIELRDRVVLDTGEVVAKYALMKARMLDRKDLGLLKVLPQHDVERRNIREFNRFVRRDGPKLEVFQEGEIEGPPPSSYEWSIPEEYRTLDVVDRAVEGLVRLNLPDDVLPIYQQRLAEELGEMERRGMYDFIRSLIYVTDQYRAKDVVWGVGRGSSCASLVLFVLGVNKVDPVKYDIPVEEFLKPGVSDE